MIIKQQLDLRKQDESIEIDTAELIRKRSYFQKDHRENHTPQRRSETTQYTSQAPCGWCGKRHKFGRGNCPTKAAICRKCQKLGHFQAVCRSSSNTVNTIADSGEDSDIFMGGIDETIDGQIAIKPWIVTVVLNGTPIEFKLDTGADVTAITPEIYDRMGKLILDQNDRILKGPGQEVLKVKGKFSADIQWKHQKVRETIYIIEHLKTPLLGRAVIQVC